MPLRNIDYSKIVIYKIQHNTKSEFLYIGSTTDFTRRKTQHKSSCNKEKNVKYNRYVYTIIRENGGWDCFSMVQIKEFPCNNRREAEAEEYKIIHELKANLNYQKYSGDQEKQYKLDNIERMRAYQITYINKPEKKELRKQYIEMNKEKTILYQKEYHKEQYKLHGKEYREANKDKINERTRKIYHDGTLTEIQKENRKNAKKKYYEANKENINAKHKTYYEENKEKINARRNKKTKI